MELKLNELTIAEAIKGLKKKKFSCEDLTKACLSRIKKVDGEINAFITVCAKEALKQAREADKLISKRGVGVFEEKPLLGIPIGVKDIFLTKGIKTTAGSKVLQNYIPQYDATAVKRLKDAGAVIIGKTNLDAWAHGSSGENSDFFPTRNPWNLAYVPGGSSSGSGAAVSAGECLGALGTDTGGSVRLPAAFCNLVGLKPTYGRVSRYGVIAMASSFDSPGCMARTADDCFLIFRVITGVDRHDATMPDVSMPDYIPRSGKKLKGLKIGVPKEYFKREINQEVRKKLNEALRHFENMGMEIVNVSLPRTKYALATYYILVSSEVSSNLARYDGIRFGNKWKKFGDEAKRRIMLGAYSLSSGYYDAYYLKAQKIRTLIKDDFKKVFEKVDLLISPSSPSLPFKLGKKAKQPLMMYLSDVLLCPVNLAGITALSLPCGFSQGGLPIGMQIIGPQFEEKLLFKIAYAYQKITEWHKRRPV